jgi:transposase InsO family protein
LLSVISTTDQQAVENLEYAGDIWVYVTKKYTKANYSTLTAAFASYFRCEKNETQSVEEAAQEIEYLANRISQMDGPLMDIQITKFLFLRGLPAAYESARQTLESQDVSMEEMVLWLTEIELRMRSSSHEDELANTARAEWIKSAKCHKCGKKGHLKKFCRTPKKDWVKKDNKKDENEASGDEKPKKNKASRRRQQAKAAQEIDLDSENSESDESAALAIEAEEAEAAMLAYENRPRDGWLIDSGVTSHCTGDRSIFTSFTPVSKSLSGVGGSPMITGRGNATIRLPNGSTARLSGVLMVPGMKTNLLSTQALRVDCGITNREELHGYEFYKNGRLIAKGTHYGKTSYLTWIREPKALYMTKLIKESAYIAAAGGSRVVSARILHRRLGHPGRRRLTQLKNTVQDFEVFGIEDLPDLKDCAVCIKAKKTRLQRRLPATRAKKPLDRVFMDYWGPYRRSGSITGDEYIVTITDDCTRYGWIFLTNTRSSRVLLEKFSKWRKQVERETGRKLKRVRCDNIPEFKAFAEQIEKDGIMVEFTTPYTPEQNGVAERMNRTLLAIMRALIFEAGIPKTFWSYAAKTACYIRNRSVIVRPVDGSAKKKKTPYELWTGEKLKIAHMRVWGCKCWIHEQNADKLDPRAIEGVFIGYTDHPSQYLVWVPERKDVIKATNPIFMEDDQQILTPEEPKISDLAELGGAQRGGAQQNPPPDETESAAEDSSDEDENLNEDAGEDREAGENQQSTSQLGATTRSGRTVKLTEEMKQSKAQEAERKRKKTATREVADMILEHAMIAKETAQQEGAKIDQIPLPGSYLEAIQHPRYGPKWKEAIQNELNSLGMFQTWKLVKRPLNQPVVSCKWVFLVKYGTDGRPERFKARLVARGFTQQFGVNYEDTFAPVIRFESLRVLFAIAAKEKLVIHLMDAQNAYLNSDLDKELYMDAPEGVAAEGKVCLLLKSIYGLKQSANLWNKKIASMLRSIGFEPTTAEPSIFIDQRGVIIALYVDDLLILAKNESDVKRVKKQIKKAHLMKDIREVSKVLGIRVTRPTNTGFVRIDQSHYIQQILMEFGMENSKPATTSMDPSIKLDNETSEILSRNDHELYRRIVGKTMFAAIATRIDIALAVNRLSQYLSEPRKVHLQAAKHILRYLKGSPDLGILYRSAGDLVGYADAAYANARKFRSTTGFCYTIGGAPISWTSKRQSITAQSTTEAEYIALSEAGKQAVWLRHLLHTLRKPDVYKKKSTIIYRDNIGSIDLSANPVFHSRTKHIHVRYHAIREYIENSEIRVLHLPTDRMLADGLTKGLDRVKFERMIEGFGLTKE